MTYENLLNNNELFSLLYRGNTSEACIQFEEKCKQLGTLSLRQIRLYLSSINHGMYHYLIHQENVALHQCCYENDLLIQDCTYQNYLAIGRQLIIAYGNCDTYLFEKYQNEHIKKAVSYIHNHLNDPITLPMLCKEVSLNQCYFCNLFRKEVGMTFREYLLTQRITLAKKLLQNTDLPLTIVAEKCGFNQLSYFCTSFKKAEGITPLAYSKQCLQSI